MAKPVSIIALCHNRWNDARRCFESIKRSTPPGLYELLVYDQASIDGTLAGLRRMQKDWPELKVYENKRNLPFAQAVNRGMRAGKGEYFLWLNNDTIVSPGWLQGLIRAAAPKDAGASGPMTDNMAPKAQVSRRFKNRPRGGVAATEFLGGFCFLLKRAAAERAGFLDERFIWGWEDMDYCLRLRQNGYGLRLAKGVFVHHVGNRTISTMQRTARRKTDMANRTLIRNKWMQTTPWRGDLMALMEDFPDPDWRLKRPESSVIMLCDGWERTRASLRTLRLDAGRLPLEVLAIPFNTDRETARGLRSMARDWPALKVLGPWRGIPWTNAVNMALGQSQGKHMLLLSPEVRVTPGWLEKLMGTSKVEDNIGLVGPNSNGKAKRGWYRVPHLVESCLLIPRRTLELHGFFDDRFAGPLGAVDYSLRVQQAGYQVVESGGVRLQTKPAPITREHPEDTRLFFSKWAGHPLYESLAPR